MARIVVVEDEFQVLALAESVLRQAGYDTASASTLAEAQAIIAADEKLDLVFTDLGLADQAEAGILIGKFTEQTKAGTPILYTSGRTLTDGMRSLFVERSEFLQKPYTAEELIKAVGELLRKWPLPTNGQSEPVQLTVIHGGRDNK